MSLPDIKDSRQKISKRGMQLVIPVFLTILAFIISMYFIFIPNLQQNLISQKKEMIRELTQAAISIIDEYYQQYRNGELNNTVARDQAFSIINELRYGDQNKDYFWVTDMQPMMLVHPFRPDLLGKELISYEDPKGKKLFLESVAIVKNEGEGFVDYYWQWKDDSTRIVPKLSYVAGFDPWKLIIGTGIYLNDVQDEILRLKARLMWVSAIIILLVASLLYFILRTSLLIEKKRRIAELELEKSKEKYRSLVEASREGTILSLENRISYVNPKFISRFGYTEEDLRGESSEQFFKLTRPSPAAIEAYKQFRESPDKSFNLETTFITKNNELVSVLLTLSKITIGEQPGCIFVIKELSPQEKLTNQLAELSEEVQTSLLFMNQPVHLIARKPLLCPMYTTVKSCADMMRRASQDAILIIGPKNEYLGIITDKDLRNRAISTNFDVSKQVYEIMTSPLISIPGNALLFEAMLALDENQITHVGVSSTDGQISGLISHLDLLHAQQNTSSFLMRRISQAELPEDLMKYSQKTKGIIKALEQSGAKTKNITRIISAITDALTIRFIELGINTLGPAPSKFAFISMGSEGRGEQTLATDQDNAIIIEDVNPENEALVSGYFLKLGNLVNEWLAQAGYELCTGEIMARNPKWNKSLTKWKLSISTWAKDASPQSVMDASIFYDFRHIFGDDTLTKDLESFVGKTVRNQSVFYYHVAQEALKFKPGSISSGNLDVKKAIFPLTNFARIYCLSNGILEQNTFSRLNILITSGLLGKDFGNRIINAYDFLMMLRFHVQLDAFQHNKQPGNIVELNSLPDFDRNRLKVALSVVAETQAQLKLDFNQ
jgi:PAS domain S-box-containing protein